jgi:hypothetical protein
VASVDELVGLVALVALGLALSLIVDQPLAWMLIGALEVAVAVGVSRVCRVPLLPRRATGRSAWVLPSFLVLSAAFALRLPVFGSGVVVAGGLLVATALFAVAVAVEWPSVDALERRQETAKLARSLLVYVAAFGLFSSVYAAGPGSLLSAAVTLVCAVALSSWLLSDEARRGATFAGGIGLVMGVLARALGHWGTHVLTAGIVLVLALYAQVGLAAAALRQQLDGRLAAEYGLVGLAGLAVVLGTGL